MYFSFSYLYKQHDNLKAGLENEHETENRSVFDMPFVCCKNPAELELHELNQNDHVIHGDLRMFQRASSA